MRAAGIWWLTRPGEHRTIGADGGAIKSNQLLQSAAKLLQLEVENFRIADAFQHRADNGERLGKAAGVL
jgi:hypothetical protein